jgi:hypothetical protein
MTSWRPAARPVARPQRPGAQASSGAGAAGLLDYRATYSCVGDTRALGQATGVGHGPVAYTSSSRETHPLACRWKKSSCTKGQDGEGGGGQAAQHGFEHELLIARRDGALSPVCPVAARVGAMVIPGQVRQGAALRRRGVLPRGVLRRRSTCGCGPGRAPARAPGSGAARVATTPGARELARGGKASEQPAARKAPPKASRASAASRAQRGAGKGELRQLSKAELYQRATEHGVPGRSKMSREELVEALARAGRRRKRSAA